MTTLWMKTVNTEKALESHISEILEILDKDYHDWWVLQTKFFQQRILNRSFVESFQAISSDFLNFEKLKQRKETTLS